MLSVRLSNDIEQRLTNLALLTGRSKSFYVKEMIEKQIDATEKFYQTQTINPNQQARLELKNGQLPAVSVQDFYQELDELFDE